VEVELRLEAELTAMRVRVEIWEQTQALPEGSQVVFRIVEGEG